MPVHIHDTPSYLELGASLVNFSQIQELVPLAWVSLELFKITGNMAFLQQSYDACSRWDAWLAANRMTRGKGVLETFCEFDMGFDFSPRAHAGGIPKTCRDNEARNCPDVPCLPLLAPDLSAVAYGSRQALAGMARLLNRKSEATEWLEKAEVLRTAIYANCWDEADEFFFDVDASGARRKYCTIHITHLLSEGVLSPEHFERVYCRYIKNPDAFWTAYPLPSISISDPSFSKTGHTIPNSWAYWSNAPCMYRLSRWMGRYGKQDDLKFIMSRWLEAAGKQWPNDVTQAIDPFTGAWTPASPNHSNTLFFLVEACQTLGHPIETGEEECLDDQTHSPAATAPPRHA